MSKHAIIVGVGPGIGLSLVETFANEGFFVTMMSRSQERLINYKNSLKEQGLNVDYELADASHFDNLANAITTAIEKNGDPEVLIYNGAAMGQNRPLEYPAISFVEDYKVNVIGAIQASQTAAPYMIEAGKATILFTGGGFAHQPNMDFASLSLGKSGLLTAAHLLHQELKGHGVKVGTITVNGPVEKRSAFDPGKIAEKYLELHNMALSAQWKIEYPFNG